MINALPKDCIIRCRYEECEKIIEKNERFPCERCKIIHYCSKEHWKKDKTHEKVCKVVRQCKFCKKIKKKLKHCSACKVTLYCSEECQKKHWKIHKKMCDFLKNETRNTQKNLGNEKNTKKIFRAFENTEEVGGLKDMLCQIFSTINKIIEKEQKKEGSKKQDIEKLKNYRDILEKYLDTFLKNEKKIPLTEKKILEMVNFDKLKKVSEDQQNPILKSNFSKRLKFRYFIIKGMIEAKFLSLFKELKEKEIFLEKEILQSVIFINQETFSFMINAGKSLGDLEKISNKKNFMNFIKICSEKNNVTDEFLEKTLLLFQNYYTKDEKYTQMVEELLKKPLLFDKEEHESIMNLRNSNKIAFENHLLTIKILYYWKIIKESFMQMGLFDILRKK